MDMGDYIGIDYHKKYTTIEFNNILSKFDNLNMRKFRMDNRILELLAQVLRKI